MSTVTLTYAHDHECAQQGKVVQRVLPVDEGGTVDVPRAVCADGKSQFLGCELRLVGRRFDG